MNTVEDGLPQQLIGGGRAKQVQRGRVQISKALVHGDEDGVRRAFGKQIKLVYGLVHRLSPPGMARARCSVISSEKGGSMILLQKFRPRSRTGPEKVVRKSDMPTPLSPFTSHLA